MTANERKNLDRAIPLLTMFIFMIGTFSIFIDSFKICANILPAIYGLKTLNNDWLPFVCNKNPEGRWPLHVCGLLGVALGCCFCIRLFYTWLVRSWIRPTAWVIASSHGTHRGAYGSFEADPFIGFGILSVLRAPDERKPYPFPRLCGGSRQDGEDMPLEDPAERGFAPRPAASRRPETAYEQLQRLGAQMTAQAIPLVEAVAQGPTRQAPGFAPVAAGVGNSPPPPRFERSIATPKAAAKAAAPDNGAGVFGDEEPGAAKAAPVLRAPQPVAATAAPATPADRRASIPGETPAVIREQGYGGPADMQEMYRRGEEQAALMKDQWNSMMQKIEESRRESAAFLEQHFAKQTVDEDTKTMIAKAVQEALKAERDMQAAVIAEAEAVTSPSPAPRVAYRASIAEREREANALETIQGVKVTEAVFELTSLMHKRAAEFHPMSEFCSNIKDKPLPTRLDMLMKWYRAAAATVGTMTDQGDDVWSALHHGITDWLEQWVDRAQTDDQELWTFADLWPGAAAGVNLAKWCAQVYDPLLKTLDSKCLAEHTALVDDLQLNGFQRVCSVFCVAHMTYGVQNISDLRQLLLKVQRPAAYLENLDGIEWEAALGRWLQLYKALDRMLSNSRVERAGFRPNELLISMSFSELVERVIRMTENYEHDTLFALYKSTGLRTLTPYDGANLEIYAKLKGMFHNNATIKGWERPKKPPKVANIADGGNGGGGGGGRGSGGGGGKAPAGGKAPDGKKPAGGKEKGTKAKGEAPAKDVGGKKKEEKPTLTPEQQRTKDYALEGYAHWHDKKKDEKDLTALLATKWDLHAWAAYHQLNSKPKGPKPGKGSSGGGGKGKGKGKGGGQLSWPNQPHQGQVQFCRDFQSGNCWRGANCKFSHDTGGWPQQPTPAWPGPGAQAAAANAQQGLGRRQGCLYWRALGACSRANCPFSHDPVIQFKSVKDVPDSQIP